MRDEDVIRAATRRGELAVLHYGREILYVSEDLSPTSADVVMQLLVDLRHWVNNHEAAAPGATWLFVVERAARLYTRESATPLAGMGRRLNPPLAGEAGRGLNARREPRVRWEREMAVRVAALGGNVLGFGPEPEEGENEDVSEETDENEEIDENTEVDLNGDSV